MPGPTPPVCCCSGATPEINHAAENLRGTRNLLDAGDQGVRAAGGHSKGPQSDAGPTTNDTETDSGVDIDDGGRSSSHP